MKQSKTKSKPKEKKPNIQPLPIQPEPMKGFGGGFRQEWIRTEFEGAKATLYSGAGLGNAALTLCVEKDGKSYWEIVNVAVLFEAWLTDVLVRIPAPAKTTRKPVARKRAKP